MSAFAIETVDTIEPQAPGRHRAQRKHHLPNRTSLQYAVTSITTKQGRAARALRKGVEGQGIERETATGTKIYAVHTTSAAVATAAALAAATSAGEFRPAGRASVAVDSAGEATRTIPVAVTDGLMQFATRVTESVERAYPTTWWTQVFESEIERKNRFDAQAFAGAVSLAATALSVISKHATKK